MFFFRVEENVQLNVEQTGNVHHSPIILLRRVCQYWNSTFFSVTSQCTTSKESNLWISNVPLLGQKPFGAAIFLWCHCQGLCLTVKRWLYMKSHCELLHKTHSQLATHLREDCREKGLRERETVTGGQDGELWSLKGLIWSARQRKFKLWKSLC